MKGGGEFVVGGGEDDRRIGACVKEELYALRVLRCSWGEGENCFLGEGGGIVFLGVRIVFLEGKRIVIVLEGGYLEEQLRTITLVPPPHPPPTHTNPRTPLLPQHTAAPSSRQHYATPNWPHA